MRCLIQLKGPFPVPVPVQGKVRGSHNFTPIKVDAEKLNTSELPGMGAHVVYSPATMWQC